MFAAPGNALDSGIRLHDTGEMNIDLSSCREVRARQADAAAGSRVAVECVAYRLLVLVMEGQPAAFDPSVVSQRPIDHRIDPKEDQAARPVDATASFLDALHPSHPLRLHVSGGAEAAPPRPKVGDENQFLTRGIRPRSCESTPNGPRD